MIGLVFQAIRLVRPNELVICVSRAFTEQGIAMLSGILTPTVPLTESK